METIILSMYVTLMPVIIAGVANMKLLKSSWLKDWTKPIDGGRKWLDGNPWFGKNKTWRGAVGMIVCSIMAMIVWGWLCSWIPILEEQNQFYQNQTNSLFLNIWIGFLLGASYIVFELPNSFLKRRKGIEPGKASEAQQPLKYMWLDQMDSLFGCALVVAYYNPMSIWQYLGYVLLGAATHLLVNWLLVRVGWKKSI